MDFDEETIDFIESNASSILLEVADDPTMVASTSGDHSDEVGVSGTDGSWADVVGEVVYDEKELERLESTLDNADDNFQKMKSCCYKLQFDNDDIYKKIISLMEGVDLKNSTGCLVNNIRNCLECIKFLKLKGIPDERVDYMLIDKFLRSRHEILHNLSMLSLRQSVEQTDQSFSELFPFMDSKRTPDRIIKMGNVIFIFETTATLNIYKGYISKGKMEEGFNSKYQKEINQLISEGYNVNYTVLSFDVKNVNSTEYLLDIKKAASLMGVLIEDEYLRKLEHIRLLYCNYSSDIVKLFAKEITSLLTDYVVFSKTTDKFDFLIDKDAEQLQDYEIMNVSLNVFNRVCNSWPRFSGMISSLARRETKNLFKPYFDHYNNKFRFHPDKNGETLDFWAAIVKNEDTITFCKSLKQVYGATEFKPIRSEIEFFERIPLNLVKRDDGNILDQSEHANTTVWDKESEIDLNKYEQNVELGKKYECKHKNSDSDYETLLINSISNLYKDLDTEEKFDEYCNGLLKKPFSAYTLTKEVIEKSILLFNERMIEQNSPSGMNINYQKQPFILPMADLSSTNYTSYKEKPNVAIQAISMAAKGLYTSKVIDMISQASFIWGGNLTENTPEAEDIIREIKNKNYQLSQIQLDFMIKNKVGRVPKLDDDESKSIKNELSALNIKLSNISGKSKKKMSCVRIPTKKNSVMREAFDKEMSHFRSKRSKSVYKGVGLLDHIDLKSDFLNLKMELLAPATINCPDSLYHDFVADDCTLLKQLKSDYLEFHRPRYEALKGTNLYHTAAFVSRFCHTLNYVSQGSLSGDYVVADNLGYDNVLLLIRGGKKIFKTKKSKLFRLFYPIHSSIANWYKDPFLDGSTEVCKFNGVLYALTPWKCIDETVLVDGLTFLHRAMAYVLLSHEPDISLSMDKCFFNITLSFHAKRKTEELLHNLRYVCVNSISNVSRLDLMFPELAGYNNDYFQCFIRKSLSENFFSFSKCLMDYNNDKRASKDYFKKADLKTLFDGSPIENLEDLTMTIYSTFLMSKSPTNQKLEQVKNLKSMLKTYIVHTKESSKDLENRYENNNKELKTELTQHWNELFESDFNYDSKFCVSLGNFTKSYLLNLTTEGDLNSKWFSILNKNWDEFSNTKGLRSDLDSHFFNRKGYYVVYDHILRDGVTLDGVKKLLLNNEIDDFEKRKQLKGLNQTYAQKIENDKLNMAIFHVVDKKQRGGSREIFVMDLKTKINQQVIEKYLMHICKLIPNEAISIPSNRRLQHIHSNVFEKFMGSDKDIYNLTLDCRKWAPHSVIEKFIDFMLPMSGIFPRSFMVHFMNFFSKMIDKRIYTRKGIFDYLKSNENCKEYCDLLTADENKGGYYFEPSYTWVMGIFNYMSSFMHVMNQIYASHIILKSSQLGNGNVVNLHMNAHSDDSGGKLVVENQLEMKKTFFIYEYLLKCSNHMLSDKKSNISKKYFEFLSVLYINNKLLTLLTKITGSFNFHPTDSGYCVDISECYSKCIEIASNGGTFDICYLSMKILSHLIYKFYFNKDPTQSDYNKPPQILGMPDSHPILMMLSGSDSDIIRLTYKSEDKFLIYLYISDYFNKGTNLQDELIKPILAKPNIRISNELKAHKEVIKISELDENIRWVIKNLNTKNSGINLLKYADFLEDKGFVASLIDENLTRRISRAFHFRTKYALDTPIGRTSYKVIKDSIDVTLLKSDERVDCEFDEQGEAVMKIFEKGFEEYKQQSHKLYPMYKLLNREVFALMKNLENISYSQADVKIQMKTCKPIHVNMQKTTLPTTTQFDPAALCIWMKEESLRWLIDRGEDYKGQSIQVESFLDSQGFHASDFNRNWIYNLLKRFKSKYIKEYFIYSNMPHNVRDITSYKDFLLYLSHNSFRNKYIEGITMPLGQNITSTMDMLLNTSFSDELLNILTFIDYCFCILNENTILKTVLKLEMNGDVLNCKSTKLYNMICELITKWETILETRAFVVPHLKTIKSHMDDDMRSAPWLSESYYYCFLKKQKLIGNVWLGKGILYINTPVFKVELHLDSHKLIEIKGDKTHAYLDKYTIGYINFVLMNANLPRLEDGMTQPTEMNWELPSLGINNSGFLCVDKVRNLKMCVPNYKYIRAHTNDATQLSTAELKIGKNFSYEICLRDELYSEKRLTLNVFKTESKTTYDILNKIYDSESNRRYLSDLGENYSEYFKMFVGDVIGVDLKVPRERFFEFYKISRCYYMIYSLFKAQRLNERDFENRKHLYPGQTGGFLSCLLQLKDIDSDFEFDGEVIMSQEMMSLKSTQPEVFISNLVTNVKKKFEKLYTQADKEAISNELLKLHSLLSGEDYKKKLLFMLTTWGYVGVMGSLEELKFEKKIDNYYSIRHRQDDDTYQFDRNVIVVFFCSILDAASKYNYFNTKQSGLLICKSMEELKATFISYVHSHMLNTYDVKTKNVTQTPNIELFRMHQTLEALFDTAGFEEELENIVKNEPLLNILPMSKIHLNNMLIMFETIMMNVTRHQNSPGKLDFEKVRQHDHNLIQPYVKTREFFEGSKISFSLSGLNRHGTTSRNTIDRLNSHKIIELDGQFYDYCCSKGEFSKEKIELNKYFYIPHPMDPEKIEDCDEYEDIKYELVSDEPDIDTIEETISDLYLDDYKRVSRIRVKGKSVFANHVNAKYFLLFNQKSNITLLNGVRNAATTVVIVTNCYLSDLMETSDERVQIFYKPHEQWKNNLLLDPCSTIFYVMDSKKINIRVWEKFLNVKRLPKEDIVDIRYNLKCCTYINEMGNKLSAQKYQDNNEKLDFLVQKIMELEAEAKGKETVEEMPSTVAQTGVRNLVNYGYSPEFVSKLEKSFWKKGDKIKGFDTIIKSYLDEGKIQKILSDKTKQDIKSVVSKVSDVNTSLKIFEVATVFSSGQNSSSIYKNRSLKDKRMRAEVNSLGERLIDMILSGRLSISSSYRNVFSKLIEGFRFYTKHTTQNKNNKSFLLDIASLILNDAYDEELNNEDDTFIELANFLTDKVIEGELKTGMSAETYDTPPNQGRMGYDWV